MDEKLQPNWQIQLERLEGAYASNTIRSYHTDVKQFVWWCEGAKVPPFPLEGETLVAYLGHIQAAPSYATIRRKIAVVRRMHALLGHGPAPRDEDFNLAYRRMKRTKSLRQRQARGINEALLLRAISAQPDTLTGIRNRALLSLGYDFLARRSELAGITVQDITFPGDGSLRGVIRRSKADQYGHGRLCFGSQRSAKLLRQWLRAKPKDVHWVFCALSHGRCIDRPICDRSVNKIIKQSIVRLRGERPREAEISGHSLRVGAAQDLLIKGFSTSAIMRAGGWRSLSVLHKYLNLAEHNVWT